jgi:hypothetical protein
VLQLAAKFDHLVGAVSAVNHVEKCDRLSVTVIFSEEIFAEFLFKVDF